jgi:hypothetical protein
MLFRKGHYNIKYIVAGYFFSSWSEEFSRQGREYENFEYYLFDEEP